MPIFQRKDLKLAIYIVLIFITVVTIVSVICSTNNLFFINMQDYFRSPQLSKRDRQAEKYIQDKLKNKKYSLIYPKNGLNRFPITYIDLDNDNTDEAIIFCNDDNSNSIHLFILRYTDNFWTELIATKVSAIGVDQFFVSDLNSDGKSEIIVGFTSNNDTKNKLWVYAYTDDAEDIKINPYEIDLPYRYFYVGNFDSDNEEEIFLTGKKTSSESASELDNRTFFLCKLIKFDKSKNFQEMAKYDEENEIGNEMKSEVMGRGFPFPDLENLNISYCYIDSTTQGILFTKLSGNRVFSFIYYDELTHSFKIPASPDRDSIMSIGSELPCCDIDGDGTIEIPGIISGFYYYFNYDSKNSKWTAKIGALWDYYLDFFIKIPLDSAIEMIESKQFPREYGKDHNCLLIRSRESFEDILSLKSFDKSFWENSYDNEGYIEIARNDTRVYAVKYMSDEIDEIFSLENLREGIVFLPFPVSRLYER